MDVSQKHNILLEAVNVNKHFGGIFALNGVTLSLEKGTVSSLIGPNGAGKTTFINVVTGIHKANEGDIFFNNKNIAKMPAHNVATEGIGRTFQLEELFGSLTVLENAMVGCHSNTRSEMLSCGFGILSARREEKRIKNNAMENLVMLGLEKKAFDPVSKLPLGERKLVGIARALSMKPTLLMLDEPAGGLAAHEVKKLTDLIYQLLSNNLTILIVEHNMPFVMSLSEKVIVLENGSKIAEGPPDEIRVNEEVIKAYLGVEDCYE